MAHDLKTPGGPAAFDEDTPVWTPTIHRRVTLATIAVLCVVLLIVLPPYISVSRYQRRVASAMTGALGRPVHFDTISLQLLPVPGLVIQNFTVSEDPPFGAEPVLRASTVTARLRFGSLWRRRIEVSRISLDAPSVNLVRRPGDGRWNLQGILQQASQLNSAPTAQTKAGDAPRFPYIEATGARINVKNGIDKLPFSIREADFSLWLPQPAEWHLRFSGRPVRTDTDVSDVGLLKVEATLGRAADLQRVPIDLAASWKRTPLGEASKLTAGYDLGWRGDASAEMSLHGTVAEAKLMTDLHLLTLRRADFFPEHPMDVQAHCEAVLASISRSAEDVRCAIPANGGTSAVGLFQALRPAPAEEQETKPDVLVLRGAVKNLLDVHTLSGTASLTGASPDFALAWIRLLSRRVPQDASVGGTLNLSAATAGDGEPRDRWSLSIACDCTLPPAHPSTDADANEVASATKPGISKRASAPSSAERAAQLDGNEVASRIWSIAVRHDASRTGTQAGALSITASPESPKTSKDDGTAPRTPDTSPLVSGQISTHGYALTYASPDMVKTFAAILPQLADNMPGETTGALHVEHVWNRPQSWSSAAPARRPAKRIRRRHTS